MNVAALRRFILPLLLLPGLLLFAPLAAFGQMANPAANTPVGSSSKASLPGNAASPLSSSVDAPQFAALLQKVHLNLGETTAQQFAASLSAQSGQKIYVEEAIRGRLLTVQMNSISARDALDTLTECQEWRWFRAEDGIFWIARRRPVLPRATAQLPAMLKAALPPDYRRFLGADVALKDLPPVEFIPANGIPQVQPSAYPPEYQRGERVLSRLVNLSKMYRKQLLNEFPFEHSTTSFVAETKDYPLTKMTEAQKTLLDNAFLLELLTHAIDERYVGLLCLGLLPYEADTNTAVLRIRQGNDFNIGTVTHSGGYSIEVSFGTSIPGLKAIPVAFPSPSPQRP